MEFLQVGQSREIVLQDIGQQAEFWGFLQWEFLKEPFLQLLVVRDIAEVLVELF